MSQNDINELIEKKLDKEANRYIQNWPDEKIAIENARWGPIIKFGKLVLKLIKDKGGKFTPEELSVLSLEDVKKMILAQVPKAFDKKGAKKSAAKKIVSATQSKEQSLKKAASKKTLPVKKVTAKKVAVKKTTKKSSKK